MTAAETSKYFQLRTRNNIDEINWCVILYFLCSKENLWSWLFNFILKTSHSSSVGTNFFLFITKHQEIPSRPGLLLRFRLFWMILLVQCYGEVTMVLSISSIEQKLSTGYWLSWSSNIPWWRGDMGTVVLRLQGEHIRPDRPSCNLNKRDKITEQGCDWSSSLLHQVTAHLVSHFNWLKHKIFQEDEYPVTWTHGQLFLSLRGERREVC